MIKKMIKKMIYLYVLLLPVSPFLSRIYIYRYSVLTLLSVFWFCISLISCFQNVCKRYLTRTEVQGFLLLISFLIGLIAGVILGWPPLKIISNASVYYTPFFMYYVIRKNRLEIAMFLKFAIAGIFIATIVSILIVLGVLDSMILVGETITFGTNYNINYVDATSGIFAIIIAFYYCFDETQRKKILGITLGICGVVIVVLNQSRGYLLTVFIVIACMIYSWFITDNISENVNTLLKMVLIVGVIILLVSITENPIKEYVIRIFERLNETQIGESNLTYRFSEIHEYFEFFKDNPFFGKGWGLINNDTTISGYTSRYRAHNTFFALLGATGLSFTPLFIIALVNLILLCFRYLKECKEKIYAVGFSSTMSVVGLSIANAGLENYFCMVFIIFAYILIVKREQEIA